MRRFGAELILLLFAGAAASAAAQPSPDPYVYKRFSSSVAIIIVVLIAALFFMVFFSIYIRNCSEGQAGSAAGTAAGRSRRGAAAAARGLDAAVIATFPTLEYSAVKGLKIGKGALECAVCLCEFEDDETLRLIPKCDHVFHPECIDTWLESHTTCPVCRAELVPNPAGAENQAEQADHQHDIESQTSAVEPAVEEARVVCEPEPVQVTPEPEVVEVGKTLNRNRTRGGSRSSRFKRFFPRSHSTGHSLILPGENTERFTLRLPVEVRKEIVSRQLERASSMESLPREASSRRGYRTGTGTGEGSSRGGRYGPSRRLDRLNMAKSDRWVFFGRMLSMKSPKVAATDPGEGPSKHIVEPDLPRSDSARPPV